MHTAYAYTPLSTEKVDEIGLSTIKNLLLWITPHFFSPLFLAVFWKNSAKPFIS